MTESTASLLTFGIGPHDYAVPLGGIREVVGCREVVRVPGASEAMRGLMNLRGNVVPVVDLARHLGVGETAVSDSTCAVLIETDLDGTHSLIGALVEAIHAVLEIPETAIALPPDFGTPVDPRMLRGVVPAGEGVVHLLDMTALLSSLASAGGAR